MISQFVMAIGTVRLSDSKQLYEQDYNAHYTPALLNLTEISSHTDQYVMFSGKG